jgi:hypothetical protein
LRLASAVLNDKAAVARATANHEFPNFDYDAGADGTLTQSQNSARTRAPASRLGLKRRPGSES